MGRRRAVPGRRFVGDRWSEWNGRFRDDVRAFVKGDRATVKTITQRFLGSPDLYGHKHREPGASINFVTCHDGFTLNDLVCYDAKHNEANGEDGRDGTDHNISWNCGVEGPTDDPAIEALRRRQVKNLLAIDLLAVGTPMLLMGDEVRRSQGGNNNAYGHDDQTSWFDWSGVDRHADVLRFTRGLIAIRKHVAGLLDLPDDLALLDMLADASLEWSGTMIGAPDLGDDSHSIALTLGSDHGALHLILNAYWEPLDFELPRPTSTVTAGIASSTPAWTRRTTSRPPTPRRPRWTAPLSRRLALGGPAGRPSRAGWPGSKEEAMTAGAERKRMKDAGHPENGWREASPWYQWGPYLSERAWGSVREDYTASGDAWNSFPHDHARSRAYRWNEDGMAGITDVFNRLSLALSLWNGKDPILKERMFGLTEFGGQPRRGRQGVLVVPRRAAEQRLARVALPLPAGRVPVRRAGRGERRPVQARAGIRVDRHRRLRRRPLLDRRGPTTRRRPRPTS